MFSVSFTSFKDSEDNAGSDNVEGLERSDGSDKSTRSVSWLAEIALVTASESFCVTFARKDNSLRINQLVGLLENWVTR